MMMFALGYLSPTFTLQFGTFSPGVTNEQVWLSIHIHLFLLAFVLLSTKVSC